MLILADGSYQATKGLTNKLRLISNIQETTAHQF